MEISLPKNFSVFVLDDNSSNISILEHFFKDQTCNLWKSMSGIDALNKINKGLKPDIIIIRAAMDEISGFEVCKTLRKKYSSNILPVILIIEKENESHIISGFESGANDYLFMPFSKEELLVRVKTHLNVIKLNKKINQVNKQLLESEKKYRGIFEHAFEGIFQTDDKGFLLNANKSFWNITGFKPGSNKKFNIFGDTDSLFIIKTDRIQIFDTIRNNGKIFGFETKIRNENNKNIWISLSAISINGGDGSGTYYEGSIYDITVRKEKEQAERDRELAEKRTEQLKAEMHARQVKTQKELLDAFIKTIATAVEEKSAYTGGHVRRVVELSIMIANKINETDTGALKDVYFKEEEIEELKTAAWMHDIGKITTPEHVVDKSNKLQTVWDRIEKIHTRFQLIETLMEIDYFNKLEKLLIDNKDNNISDHAIQNKKDNLKKEFQIKKDELKEDFEFISKCNYSSEYMPEKEIDTLLKIASKKFKMNSKSYSYIEEDELMNLCVRKGTLTNYERSIIENHANMTIKILNQLPFPKHLAKVTEIAGAHHEKIDGSGYPNKLSGNQLSIQSRILAIADIFEALTAKDRPYRKPIKLSEALHILDIMKQNRHIDPDIFDLMVNEKIYLDYAKLELGTDQIDNN